METHSSILLTKQAFENSFAEADFYNRQTQDTRHLENILSFLPIKPGMKILDLGCGSGYLTFSIAEKYPQASILGLDIVEKALKTNKARAEAMNCLNIDFMAYDGIRFPFSDSSFDMAVSRYAPHHFPDIQKSLSEISRVLVPGGYFFLSDPTPNSDDTARFVDDYMRLKNDGHIRFYTKQEWETMCGKCSMHLVRYFDSQIRFPRKKSASVGWENVLEHHEPAVIRGYALEQTGDELLITERVNNLLFCKN